MAVSVNKYTSLLGPHRPEYTAISRKVVGKSARDNPESYCGDCRVHFFGVNLSPNSCIHKHGIVTKNILIKLSSCSFDFRFK